MLKLFETVKILHLEPTDVCQAACPLCAREIDSTFNKDIHNHLTVDKISRIIDKQVISQLDKMFMCGNYGDPAANKDTPEIFSHFRSVNNNIVLGMNTNGGLQNNQWWENLASILNKPNDYVVFSIDGLEDTNHLYRKNVVWDKVISNAESFIQAGGSAHWDMIVYEHNEHQAELCEKLAKSMGFKWFRAKVSKRPSNVSWLKPPKGWKLPAQESSGTIDCFRNNEESIYISAAGQVYPCCWLGHNTDFTISKFNNIQSSWQTPQCNPICKKNCSTIDQGTSFTNQWVKITEFKNT